MAIVYLTIEQALDTHQKTVEVSGGGTLEHLDIGKLESVLEHIQNDDYYPSLEDKLTHLFYSANKFHCFADGNKRIATT
jgi:death-on-curing protein